MTSFSAIGQASHSSRRILIRTGLFAVGCLLALISIFQLQRYLDHRIDLGVIQIEELAQLPRGEHLKPALLGYHHLVADVLWLRVLQVLGKKRNTTNDYEWIYHALNVITTLDPQYDYAYYVGGVVLTNLANRVDLSNRLLEKGFKENPTVWNIPFLLGYNYYFILGDAAKAAEYICSSSSIARWPGLSCLDLRHACMPRRTTLKLRYNFLKLSGDRLKMLTCAKSWKSERRRS